MQGQIVHDDIEPHSSGIGATQGPECHQQVANGLSFMNRSCQAVPVNVVESQKLLCAGQSPVGRRKSPGMSNPGPVLSVQGLEIQRIPFIIADNSTVPACLMVKFFFLELRIWRLFSGLGSLERQAFAPQQPPDPLIANVWQEIPGSTVV